MIAIIDYGAGNIKSVKFALDRIGVDAIVTNNAEEIKQADKVIFPGVGEASSAMLELQKYNLDKIIPSLKQPVLGICLGMQLMCDYSEEGDTNCLGIFPIKVEQFRTELKTPQVGWNNIFNLTTALFSGVKENSYTYFVHSFYIPSNEYSIADTEYDKVFSSAIKKDNFYATQFHPEKSGDIGEQILINFLKI